MMIRLLIASAMWLALGVCTALIAWLVLGVAAVVGL
jgi:hypothetical protein